MSDRRKADLMEHQWDVLFALVKASPLLTSSAFITAKNLVTQGEWKWTTLSNMDVTVPELGLGGHDDAFIQGKPSLLGKSCGLSLGGLFIYFGPKRG